MFVLLNDYDRNIVSETIACHFIIAIYGSLIISL